jgi:hypothetical protein
MTRVMRGCGPAICARVASGMSGWKAEPRERKSRVHEAKLKLAGTRVPRDTRNLVGSRGAHPPSLTTPGDR